MKHFDIVHNELGEVFAITRSVENLTCTWCRSYTAVHVWHL